MKICVVSHFSSFNKNGLKPSEISGGAKHTNNLFMEWQNLGNEIRVIGIKLNFKFMDMINYIFKFKIIFNKKLFKYLDCDIIIGNTPYPPDLLDVLRIKTKLQKPAIIYFHHLPPSLIFHPFKRGFLKVILNYVYFNFSVIICKIFNIGIFLDQPQAYKLGSIKVYRNDTALDIKPYTNNTIKLINKDVDILYMGGISKSKGFMDLVKALKILQNQGVNLNVIVTGKMDNRDKHFIRVKNKIKLNRLNINFVGFVSETEKIEYFFRAKMFVSPSYVEGWSMAVMEAAKFKVPIVAYDIPAYSYLKDNFYKVRPSNINQLAKQIKKCLNDKQVNKIFINNAFLLVSKYNYQDIANFQLSIFKSLIK